MFLKSNDLRNLIVGGFAGLLVGMAVAFVLMVVWFTGQPARANSLWPRILSYSIIIGCLTGISSAIMGTVFGRMATGDRVAESKRFTMTGCGIGAIVTFTLAMVFSSIAFADGQAILLSAFLASCVGLTTYVTTVIITRMSN